MKNTRRPWSAVVAAVICLLGLFAPPAQADSTRPYTLTLTSIYVHDDGDAGPACGDFAPDRQVSLNGHLVLRPDNGEWWGASGWGNQHYCSDDLDVMPQNLGEKINVYHGHRFVGETVHVSTHFNELDFSASGDVAAVGTKDVVIPGIGKKTDFALEAEGAGQGGHVRLTLNFELAVS